MLRGIHSGEMSMYEEYASDNWQQTAVQVEPRQAVQKAAPEAVRHCRELAKLIGASSFSLLFTSVRDEKDCLIPAFDSAFPGTSALSRALSTSLASEFVYKTSKATAPLWWCADKSAGLLACCARNWVKEVANPVTDASISSSVGIAFPVAQQHDRHGVVVFSGNNLALDERLLCEVHARCHAIFSKVACQKPLSSAIAPSMTRREIECLRLTADGQTSDNIASSLGLSIHTANQYLTSSAQKLNAVNRIHAVAKALRSGLID